MWKVYGWTFSNKSNENENDYDSDDDDVNHNDDNNNNNGDDEDNSLDHKRTEKKKKAKEIRYHTRARIRRVQSHMGSTHPSSQLKHQIGKGASFVCCLVETQK